MNRIKSFDDFCSSLIQAGFSVGGSNSEGIFSFHSYCGDDIIAHTEDPETDPWEWRMRVLNERNDIAYAKVFFKKSGFIAKEWYPYFLCARRNGNTLYDEYSNGTVSRTAKCIYELIEQNNSLPLHLIKQLGNFSKEDKSRFDSALTELQMKMFITMCGEQRKISQRGDEYGWNSTVFCTAESFFDDAVFEKARQLTLSDAEKVITEQIYILNPNADSKKIKKFIFGR